MSGEIEYGKCDMCNNEDSLSRKYYRYPIKCDCCNGKEDDHFEIVRYCSECTPEPPKKVSVVIKPFVICNCGLVIPDNKIIIENRCNEEGEDYYEGEAKCKCGKHYGWSQWGEYHNLSSAKDDLQCYIDDLN